MLLSSSFIGTNAQRERLASRIVGEAGSAGRPNRPEAMSISVLPRYLVASSLALSMVIAGLGSFVIVASLAAWTMLNQ